MELKEIESAIEGVLFAAGEPVGVERLCLALDIDRITADSVCQRLADAYRYERRGIRLVRLDNSYQLCSAPEFADCIRRAFESRRPARLSQPALEVLAIIAYYQPATRAYVDQIRGVDSSYTVSLLLERDLIEECGRLPCRAAPSSTAPPRPSCAPSDYPIWMSCPSCPTPPRRTDSLPWRCRRRWSGFRPPRPRRGQRRSPRRSCFRRPGRWAQAEEEA